MAVQLLLAMLHRVILSQVQDLTFITLELHKVPVSHLLQPTKVSLPSIRSPIDPRAFSLK